jgi:threonyl-tRNA synthetase
MVAVRTRKGEDLGQMPLDAFIARLKQEAEAREGAA